MCAVGPLWSVLGPREREESARFQKKSLETETHFAGTAVIFHASTEQVQVDSCFVREEVCQANLVQNETVRTKSRHLSSKKCSGVACSTGVRCSTVARVRCTRHPMLPELSTHPKVAVHGKRFQHDEQNADKELVLAVEQLQSLQAKRDCSKPKDAKGRKCYILPNSLVKASCDSITAVLLILLWAYEPMGLWFDAIRSTSLDTIVIVWFCFEMLTNIFTAYQDGEGELIFAQPAMLWKYCKTWFTIDLLSTIPWDRIAFGAGGDDNLLRLSRLLRLTKLFKLLRVSHYAARLVKHLDGCN